MEIMVILYVRLLICCEKIPDTVNTAQFLVVLKSICNNGHTVCYSSKSKMLTLAEQCKDIPPIHLWIAHTVFWALCLSKLSPIKPPEDTIHCTLVGTSPREVSEEAACVRNVWIAFLTSWCLARGWFLWKKH